MGHRGHHPHPAKRVTEGERECKSSYPAITRW